MNLKKKSTARPLIYAIVDIKALHKHNSASFAKKLINSGIDIIQLRYKNNNVDRFIKIAQQINKTALSKKIPLIINDLISAAKIIGASGVHLGQNDLPIEYARKRLGRHQIIGTSCHNMREIKKALKSKSDYIAIGPVFKTQTKPGLRPIGIKTLKNITKRVKIPVFAIGGINNKNISIIKPIKISGAALISYFVGEKNLKNAVKKLRFA